MKQLFLLLFFTFLCFLKTTESFISNKLGETREITIGLPSTYENPTKKTLLIVLDGDYLFDPFMAPWTMDAIGMIYLKPLLLV
jgi:predicted alpha/beta superfamily hydrolase